MSNLAEKGRQQIVIFDLDELHYALYLSAVEQFVQVVEITPLPKTPDFVLGVINVRGLITAVVDIRRRLHLPRRDLNLNDQLILARTSRRLVALVVDNVTGIRELADREFVSSEQVLPGMEYIHGLAKLDDNLVLICDLDQFLSFDEQRNLDAVMEGMAAMSGAAA